MELKIRNLIAILILALSPGSGFAQPEVEIGAILPLSGELAAFGQIVRDGIEAVRMTNARVIYDDDSCHPQRAVSAYLRFSSSQSIKLFLGPCCTTAVAAIAPLLKKNNQVAINFCTGSEQIYDVSGGTIFHSQYSAQAEAAFNAQKMWELGIRRPLIVLQESEFGSAHDAAFRDAFPGKSVKTVNYSGPDRDQIKSLILNMRGKDFDGVYIPLVETFLLGFMTEMRRAGINDKKVFGIYSVQLPALIQSEGRNIDDVIYSYPDIPTNQNAAEYFATLAAQMLDAEVKKCGMDTTCIKSGLMKDYPFNAHGFMKNELLLKTNKNGRFVAFNGG